ncbi:MAG: hypothetical protein A2X22_05325 [Bacteroidetes bacterium GWF2_49_14]|nr:MAG: hypothetical protein A2X22_05325 [Bacteroidetes bacterium GWF2_49_14]HBB93610.1 hypothetical protein [Bacteroidales bacterium]
MAKIKYIFLILTVVVFLLPGCKGKSDSDKSVSPSLVTNPVTASGKKSKTELPVMEFEQSKHDFGLVVQGEKLSYNFKFTNTGGTDLIISQASSTCGCTVPTYSKEPVKPGGHGSIEVQFDSGGRTGSVSKTVSILANTQPNTNQLEISAEVYVPDSKK